ncbi:MAG TPA: FimV/HubP family polar landmark protein, partial [Azonexus sp.]|nr:FimV/HubP family polar landmark protein [Azonexus sp.]
DNLDAANDGMTLDFDLGEQTIAPELKDVAKSQEPAADEAVAQIQADALDFDLAAEVVEPEAVPEMPLAIDEPVAAPEPEVGAIDFDLNAEAPLLDPDSATAETPDFSPEGTLVMPSASVNDDFDVGLGTWVGVEGQGGSVDTSASPEPAADDVSPFTQTVVNTLAGTDTFVGGDNLLNFSGEQDAARPTGAVVNSGGADTDSLEFDVKLTDSVFLGEPMASPDFDISSINLDLSAEPPEAVEELPEVAAPTAASEPVAASEPTVEAPARDAQWEEVNTKLDLAKAYEEMGDLEGARELLQEVVGEGPADLVEQAKTILGRIGG